MTRETRSPAGPHHRPALASPGIEASVAATVIANTSITDFFMSSAPTFLEEC